MKYLLIDGNNLACRIAFANTELKNKEGIPTGIHFGMFQSLVGLRQQFQDYQVLIVWDGKSQRRIAESNVGVKKGLIKSAYKENRKKDEIPQALKDFYSQSSYLQKGIGQTGIPQIRLAEYEADDVIASYCKKLRDSNEVVVVTTDKDYYQVLHDNVSLWNGMTLQLTRKPGWEKKFGIKPHQSIDCGAIEGDTGDNIFGVPGWGEKGSLKAIQEHSSWQKVVEFYHSKCDKFREQYPDLKDNESEFKRLADIQTKSGKPKYTEIKIDMPFTGVALAIEDAKVKDIKKNEIMILMFEERVALAYSLKKMDDEIDLPPIENGEFNEEKIKEYFDYYDIKSLEDDIWALR